MAPLSPFRPGPPVALAVALVSVLTVSAARAQNFVAVTDTTNPIVTVNIPSNASYSGAAWVDVDDDGLLDLFMVRRVPIFHNLGGGAFELQTGAIAQQGQTLGTTWSDYDNDGDIDCYLSGNHQPATNNGSWLYRNDGSFAFTKITTGDIGDGLNNSGWGTAFSDIDNDGYTDVVVAAANGFGGVFHENRLLYNNGDGSFTSIDSTVVTAALDAHTIPTWSDYDQDGDSDLFIGSGEISVLSPDNLFRNVLAETGSWGFERITTAPIATDSLDGQVWNWIDYDNDGDFDGFQTNYRFALPSNLYRNDGGTYVKMTEGDVGNIVSETGAGLANLWSDFDNDGDLDCFITNDGGSTNDYFTNDGDGTFTQDLASAIVLDAGPHWGACSADYDNDGDLDLYVHGTTATHRLFRNDLANGYAWLNVKLVGAGAPAGSNVSALGVKVRAKATIDGNPVWQLREVSAQNSFNSMNMLNVHFGLKNATTVDSLVIEWPAGSVETYLNVPVNLFLRLEEGVDATGAPVVSTRSKSSWLLQNVPNPFRPSTSIEFGVPTAGRVSLRIFDTAGRLVRTLLDESREPGRYREAWDGRDASGRAAASGVYFYRLRATTGAGQRFVESKRMVLVR